MSVRLAKPTHVLAYVGTQMGGDHDLEIRGEIVGRGPALVRVRVSKVRGGMTGLDYPHLSGSVIDLPSIVCHLF